MFLRPNGRIELDHRARFLRGSTGEIAIAAASDDGLLSILCSDLKTVHQRRLATTLNAVAVHPTSPLLALVTGESRSLVVQTLDGENVAEIKPPKLHKHAPQWIRRGFDDCYFDEGGEFLWLAAPLSDDEFEIQMVETNGWSVVDTAIEDDEFGESGLSLEGTGIHGLVSLWVAAGQDGQQVYWLTPNGQRISCYPEDDLSNSIPPVFSPDGAAFLVVNEDNAVCKYQYSNMKRKGSRVKSGIRNDSFAESICFFGQGHALASTQHGRVFLIDIDRMKVEEEVAIEGHEPAPIREYYPTLDEERDLGTDIAWFTRLGNLVVFVVRRDEGIALAGWKDTLLLSMCQ